MTLLVLKHDSSAVSVDYLRMFCLRALLFKSFLKSPLKNFVAYNSVPSGYWVACFDFAVAEIATYASLVGVLLGAAFIYWGLHLLGVLVLGINLFIFTVSLLVRGSWFWGFAIKKALKRKGGFVEIVRPVDVFNLWFGGGLLCWETFSP